MKIYVAGKLNANAVDYIKNIHRMIDYANALRRAGHSVFVPCLDILLGIFDGHYEYEDYTRNNMPFLESCDCLFVVPESKDSAGTQKEIARAKELNMPIYTELIMVP